MCAVSMVMDHYRERWDPLTAPASPNTIQILQPMPLISAEEVAEFKKLLDRAREYDKRMNQPDCEMADKRAALLKIAEQLGVEISFL